jgi:hypothetical protein
MMLARHNNSDRNAFKKKKKKKKKNSITFEDVSQNRNFVAANGVNLTVSNSVSVHENCRRILFVVSLSVFVKQNLFCVVLMEKDQNEIRFRRRNKNQTFSGCSRGACSSLREGMFINSAANTP